MVMVVRGDLELTHIQILLSRNTGNQRKLLIKGNSFLCDQGVGKLPLCCNIFHSEFSRSDLDCSDVMEKPLRAPSLAGTTKPQ